VHRRSKKKFHKGKDHPALRLLVHHDDAEGHEAGQRAELDGGKHEAGLEADFLVSRKELINEKIVLTLPEWLAWETRIRRSQF